MSTALLVINAQEALRSGEDIAHDIEAAIARSISSPPELATC
ncbi:MULTISPECIES: hypothetical protein [Pseudomonas]|nr:MULTISPECIES: hypothetical protein [Pseudomonas]